MKDDPRFKNWLKEKWSCSKCNKEFFSFQKTGKGDEIKFVFYWQNKQEPEPNSFDALFDTGIEKVCQDCRKSENK